MPSPPLAGALVTWDLSSAVGTPLYSPRLHFCLWPFLSPDLDTRPQDRVWEKYHFHITPPVAPRQLYTILLPPSAPNKSPQTTNSCKSTLLRPVPFARHDSTYLNLNLGSRWESHYI